MFKYTWLVYVHVSTIAYSTHVSFSRTAWLTVEFYWQVRVDSARDICSWYSNLGFSFYTLGHKIQGIKVKGGGEVDIISMQWQRETKTIKTTMNAGTCRATNLWLVEVV